MFWKNNQSLQHQHRYYRGYRPHLYLLDRQEYHHCHHRCQHNHEYHRRLGLDRQEYHHCYHRYLNDWGPRHYHRRHQANLTLSHLVGQMNLNHLFRIKNNQNLWKNGHRRRCDHPEYFHYRRRY